MVVHLLRHECHLAHERPRFTKGSEVKDLADRVPILDLAPAAEFLDGFLAMRARQSLDHVASPRLPHSLRELASCMRKIKPGA
jgi:hypothetical protein